MGSAKVVTVLDNDVVLTASAADHDSSVLDLQDGYGGSMDIKITNGATGPTVGAQAQVQTSPDNTHWYKAGGALGAALGSAVVSSWGDIPIPFGAKYLKVTSGSNTVQDVTIRVEATEVTAIS